MLRPPSYSAWLIATTRSPTTGSPQQKHQRSAAAARRYFHWLREEADPQNTIRENYRLKTENAILRKECERLAKRAREDA